MVWGVLHLLGVFWYHSTSCIQRLVVGSDLCWHYFAIHFWLASLLPHSAYLSAAKNNLNGRFYCDPICQSSSLSGLISLISVIAIVPYISLQLSATAQSINLLTNRAATQSHEVWADSTFYTIVLALFAILFGARRLKPSEHNPGLIASIAFESVVKLLAFLAVGLYVCFALFDSPVALFEKAHDLNIDQQVAATKSSLCVCCSPWVFWRLYVARQFHMSFIEKNNDKELASARWLFPIYLLLINLFYRLHTPD